MKTFQYKNELIESFREIASHSYNYDSLDNSLIEEAIKIRTIENLFLKLFAEGRMNGTVHTCVGQEFSAVFVINNLQSSDWITSNHRCHGHFISKTKNWKGLVDELMGFKGGVCQGIGSSQHLYSSQGFLSNGPQGALLPVASGISLYSKLNNIDSIAVSFIGEGTLGEGVFYETLNLDSLFCIPHLIVCENNLYSQSTPQNEGVAGGIEARASAFGIKVFEAHTWDLIELDRISKQAINYVRSGHPAFLIIKTYRLNPHSKGDDFRDEEEIKFFRSRDPLNILLKRERFSEFSLRFEAEVQNYLSNEQIKEHLDIADYKRDLLPRKITAFRKSHANAEVKFHEALNDFYKSSLQRGALIIGEDIRDPYGGAFKITRGLSTIDPSRVLNTSISEAGLTGIAIGYSLFGSESFAEIMFGDFITNSYDQIINNASKFFHMYGFGCSPKLRIRTPMGGGRGYGPTHSQSLEKFLVGIDNICVVAVSSILDPRVTLDGMDNLNCPIILIENKVDYSRKLWSGESEFNLTVEDKLFGAIKVVPKEANCNATIVSYGARAREILDNYYEIFRKTDILAEIICITQLHPLDINSIVKSIKKTNRLIIVEDGSISYGLGSEILARVFEEGLQPAILRIGSEPYPVPSEINLENEILPSNKILIKKLQEVTRND